MIGFLLGLVITILTGYFAVSIIEREMELRFRILFSIPLGFGITSIFYFLYLCLNINDFSDFRLFEIIALIILALIYYNEEKPNFSKHKFQRLSGWFYLLNLYALLIYLKYFIYNPMGSWDGFRIWNTKTEFLFLNNPLWQNVFELPHFMSHNDYPLLLPASTARLWNYAGEPNLVINLTIGLFFTFGVVYLLFQALEYFKSKKIALVVGSAFMILNIFLVNGASQCADIPLCYMYLACIVSLFLYFRKEKFSYIILSILFAALSAWTKNEGMMFLAAYGFVILCWLFGTKKYKKAVMAGITALIPAAAIIFFKKFAHNPNDLIAGIFILKTYHFIFDFHRYAVILKSFVSMFLLNFTILISLVLLCIKGFKIKEKNKTPFILSTVVFVLCSIGYFLIYLLSPHDIKWLVDNSIDRIMLQLLPVFLFLFAVNLRIGKPDSMN